MLAAFSVAPSGGENSDASVHDAVAAAVEIVRRSGLSHRTDSMFTTIEGEWDEVFAVIKEATEAVGEYGTRVSLVVQGRYPSGIHRRDRRQDRTSGESDRLAQRELNEIFFEFTVTRLTFGVNLFPTEEGDEQ
jgi:uncharacterized protein YqgV (UPF0045/DUF77 family)